MREICRSRLGFVVLLGVGCVGGATSLSALGGSQQGGVPVPFKPVLEVEQLMENQQIAFKGLKAAILDKKWQDARKYAWLLAELANVNRQHATEAKYSDFAGAMVDKSMDLANKLKSKDAKVASAELAELNQICSSCHKAYRK